MKYSMYCYKDVKAANFMPPPFVDQNDQTAIRGFSYAINAEGIMNFAPKDYDLYKIGEFDTEKGELIPCIPVYLCNGVDVFKDK